MSIYKVRFIPNLTGYDLTNYKNTYMYLLFIHFRIDKGVYFTAITTKCPYNLFSIIVRVSYLESYHVGKVAQFCQTTVELSAISLRWRQVTLYIDRLDWSINTDYM